MYRLQWSWDLKMCREVSSFQCVLIKEVPLYRHQGALSFQGVLNRVVPLHSSDDTSLLKTLLRLTTLQTVNWALSTLSLES